MQKFDINYFDINHYLVIIFMITKINVELFTLFIKTKSEFFNFFVKKAHNCKLFVRLESRNFRTYDFRIFEF